MAKFLERHRGGKKVEPGVPGELQDIYYALTTSDKSKSLQSSLFPRQQKRLTGQIIRVMEPWREGQGLLPAQFEISEGTIVYQGELTDPDKTILAIARGRFRERKTPAIIGGIHLPTYNRFWGIHRRYRHDDEFPTLVSEVPGRFSLLYDESYPNDHLAFRVEPSKDNQLFIVTTGDRRQKEVTRICRTLFTAPATRAEGITAVTNAISQAMQR